MSLLRMVSIVSLLQTSSCIPWSLHTLSHWYPDLRLLLGRLLTPLRDLPSSVMVFPLDEQPWLANVDWFLRTLLITVCPVSRSLFPFGKAQLGPLLPLASPACCHQSVPFPDLFIAKSMVPIILHKH